MRREIPLKLCSGWGFFLLSLATLSKVSAHEIFHTFLYTHTRTHKNVYTEIQGGEPCTCHRCPGPAWSVLSRGQMFHWRRDPRPDDLPEVTGLHEERPPRLLPRSQSPSTRSNLWLSSRPAKWSGERCARAAPRAPEAPSSSPALHPLRQVVSLLSLYFPVSKVG